MLLKLFENPSKIEQKTTQNTWKLYKIHQKTYKIDLEPIWDLCGVDFESIWIDFEPIGIDFDRF